ncbi:hypothetical protein VTI74DRAFT_5137 [Chaetomium olivicolor]
MCLPGLFGAPASPPPRPKISRPIPITMANDPRPYPYESLPNARPVTQLRPHHMVSNPRSICPFTAYPRGAPRDCMNRRARPQRRQGRPISTLGPLAEESAEGDNDDNTPKQQQLLLLPNENGNANCRPAAQRRPRRRQRKTTFGNPSERYFQAEGIEPRDFAYETLEVEEMRKREDLEAMQAELAKQGNDARDLGGEVEGEAKTEAEMELKMEVEVEVESLKAEASSDCGKEMDEVEVGEVEAKAEKEDADVAKKAEEADAEKCEVSIKKAEEGVDGDGEMTKSEEAKEKEAEAEEKEHEVVGKTRKAKAAEDAETQEVQEVEEMEEVVAAKNRASAAISA